LLQDALQLPHEFARNYRIIHYDLAFPFDIERYCSQAILCSALLLQFIKDLPNRLAETYPESAITNPFPFNAYYSESEAPDVDEDNYKLALDGLIDNKQPWTLEQLYALPQETQITRLICVEGWSAIGKWTGAPLGEFLRRVGADLTAKYVHFVCAEGYSVSIDMPTALHPQTQMTFRFAGEILPTKFGFPLRIRMPTKLGFKNPKYVVAMEVTNTDKGGYWEDQGYNWFSGS